MPTVTASEATAPVEAVAPAPQPTPEAPKVEVKPEDQVRIDQLARRERMIRNASRQLEQREKALQERELTLQKPPEPQGPSWQDRFKQDPTGVMAEVGMSYEDLLNHMVNQNPQDIALRQLQNRLQSIEDNQKKVLTQVEDQQKQSYQQAVKQIETEVRQLVRSSGDDFEVIKANGSEAEQAVVRYIEKTFEEEGYVMDISEAAKDIEEYLTEETVKLMKLKKIQGKFKPEAKEERAPSAPMASQARNKVTVQPKQATTLSHSMQVQTKPKSELSAKERAIAAFLGQKV